jgi:hypothetical protein
MEAVRRHYVLIALVVCLAFTMPVSCKRRITVIHPKQIALEDAEQGIKEVSLHDEIIALVKYALQSKSFTDPPVCKGTFTLEERLRNILLLSKQTESYLDAARQRKIQEDKIAGMAERDECWALCALLDHEDIEGRLMVLDRIRMLGNVKVVPVLLIMAKRNLYNSWRPSDNIEFRLQIKTREVLESLTKKRLIPTYLSGMTHGPNGRDMIPINSEENPEYFRGHIDVWIVEEWLRRKYNLY